MFRLGETALSEVSWHSRWSNIPHTSLNYMRRLRYAAAVVCRTLYMIYFFCSTGNLNHLQNSVAVMKCTYDYWETQTNNLSKNSNFYLFIHFHLNVNSCVFWKMQTFRYRPYLDFPKSLQVTQCWVVSDYEYWSCNKYFWTHWHSVKYLVLLRRNQWSRKTPSLKCYKNGTTATPAAAAALMMIIIIARWHHAIDKCSFVSL